MGLVFGEHAVDEVKLGGQLVRQIVLSQLPPGVQDFRDVWVDEWDLHVPAHPRRGPDESASHRSDDSGL